MITFPGLLSVGVPAVEANVTNTVALTPGYLSAPWHRSAISEDNALASKFLLPAAAIVGVAGGVLLLRTPEQAFRGLVHASERAHAGDRVRGEHRCRHPVRVLGADDLEPRAGDDDWGGVGWRAGRSLGGRVRPEALRLTVVVLGTAAGLWYLID